MNQNILFKFVSLRPVSNAHTSLSAIEADDHADGFVKAAQASSGMTVRERLQKAAEKMLPSFVLKDQKWMALYQSNETKSLFFDASESFAEWAQRVHTLLNQYGLKPEAAWYPKLWNSYLVSLFGSTQYAQASVFLHQWIHLFYFLNIKKETPPVNDRPQRIALPTKLASLMLTLSEAPLGKPPVSSQQANSLSKGQVFLEKDHQLQLLLEEVQTQRRQNFMSVANQNYNDGLVSSKPQSVKAGTPIKKMATSKATLMMILDKVKMTSLSKNAQKTLKDFSLDPEIGLKQLEEKIQQQRAQLMASAHVETKQQTLSYINGGFVRLNFMEP